MRPREFSSEWLDPVEGTREWFGRAMMNPLSSLTGQKALHQLDANEPPTDHSAAAWLIEIAADALDAGVITEAEGDILVGADVDAAFRLARSMRGPIYKTDD